MFKKNILTSVFGLVVMGLLVLGVGFIAGWFILSRGGSDEPDEPAGSGETVQGIDVSFLQGAVNWDAVRSDSIVFAYARASEGTQPDPTFRANWDEIRVARITRGAYHTFIPQQDPRMQAQFFIAQLKEAGPLRDIDLPPVLSVTESGGVPSDSLVVRIITWLEVVQVQLGRLPIVYTTKTFYDAELGGVLEPYPLWISSINREPTGLDRPWTFWQYSAQGRVGGISGGALLDRFSGSDEQLRAFIRSTKTLGSSRSTQPAAL